MSEQEHLAKCFVDLTADIHLLETRLKATADQRSWVLARLYQLVGEDEVRKLTGLSHERVTQIIERIDAPLVFIR